MDDFRGRPARLLLLLLIGHLLEDRHHPVLELAVVIIGDQEVASAVDSLGAQVAALELEVSHKGGRQALDEVLLNTTSCGDEAVHEAVLNEEADGLAQPRGDHVAGVGQEDRALLLGAIDGVAELLRVHLLDGCIG